MGSEEIACLSAVYRTLEDFQQVFRGRGRQAFHTQVLQHQQVYLSELRDDLLTGAGGIRLGHILGKVEGGAVEGGVTRLDSCHG